MEEAIEDRRLLYGTVLTLEEAREAHQTRTGVCRGCRTRYPDTGTLTKALQCGVCGRPRIFGAAQYVWNGWIKELPPGRWKGRPVNELLGEEGSHDNKRDKNA